MVRPISSIALGKPELPTLTSALSSRPGFPVTASSYVDMALTRDDNPTGTTPPFVQTREGPHPRPQLSLEGDQTGSTRSHFDRDGDSIRVSAASAGVPPNGDLGRHEQRDDNGDDQNEQYSSFIEVPDSVYERFPRHRKLIIVTLLSFCSFLSPVSSTSVLAATPEVAREYHTNGSVINLANAIYLLTMGISPVVWGPMSEVYGRRRASTCLSPHPQAERKRS